MDAATVHLKFEVKDFDNWFKAFWAESNVAARRELGLLSARIYRDVQRSDLVFSVLHWSSVEGASRYLEPKQFLARMHAAGVVGVPEIRFVREV